MEKDAFKKLDAFVLSTAISVLEDGEPLVLFPEGERKDGPIVQPLFDGAAFVAARAGVPLMTHHSWSGIPLEECPGALLASTLGGAVIWTPRIILCMDKHE